MMEWTFYPIDHAEQERQARLWSQQHPRLLRGIWTAVAGITLGCWWIAIRIGVWIVCGW